MAPASSLVVTFRAASSPAGQSPCGGASELGGTRDERDDRDLADDIGVRLASVGGETFDTIDLLRFRLLRLVDFDVPPSIREGVETPPLELLGALTRTAACLRLELESALDVVRDLERVRDSLAWEVSGAS